MPWLGAHLSVAGGLHRAIDAATALGMETVQLFTHSPSQWAVHADADGWRGKTLSESDVETFRRGLKASKLKHATAHDSYLINLASPGEELWKRSIEAFTHEIERAEALGLAYLVTHPGAHTGSGEEAGLARILTALNEALHRTAGAKVKVLLETTAGQGSTLGHRFEHLAFLLKNASDSARLGVCLDTCHVFAAGYPIHSAAGYAETFEQFDAVIGLKRLKLFHLNDSVKGLNCRVDRHAGIGAGMIGDDAFRRLMTDVRFAKLPMILETPKEDAAGTPMDAVHLAKLREFMKA